MGRRERRHYGPWSVPPRSGDRPALPADLAAQVQRDRRGEEPDEHDREQRVEHGGDDAEVAELAEHHEALQRERGVDEQPHPVAGERGEAGDERGGDPDDDRDETRDRVSSSRRPRSSW